MTGTSSADLTPAQQPHSLRAVFAGRRGRLLTGLLFAEFVAAVQSVAYSSVLPLAAREVDGQGLYGATLASGSLTALLVLAFGPTAVNRLRPRRLLLVATVVYVLGVVLAAVAPSMTWVLAGSVLRGLASGLLAGFGLAAIGGLYEDALRARVLGLFAAVWLLPSLLGPALNALIATAWGWRWAMAWPAVVVLVARLLVGRDADIVPWTASPRLRLDLLPGALVVGGLVAVSAATTGSGGVVVPLFVNGVVVALAASFRVIGGASFGNPHRLRDLAGLLGICLAFFGGSGLVTLAVIEGLGGSVTASSVAFGAGLMAWSVTGLRRPTSDARARRAGVLLVAVGLAVEAATLTFGSGSPALVAAVFGWAVAGLGMGLGYPVLAARPFDDLPAPHVPHVATAVVFAEMSGSALGSILGGGVYSFTTGLGAGAGSAITGGFSLLATVSLVSAALMRGDRVRSAVGRRAPTAARRHE